MCMKQRVARSLLPMFCCILLALLTACGNGGNGSSSSGSNPSSTPTSSAGQTPTATSASGGSPAGTTRHMPATQSTCPAAGTARAMVSANLVLGAHSNLIYVVNEYTNNTDSTPTAGTLKRYD